MSAVQGAQSAAKCAASHAVLVVCDLQQGRGDATSRRAHMDRCPAAAADSA